jgi:hypothetical protein
MVDPGRRKYYRTAPTRKQNRGTAENDRLAERLAKMSREDLLRWVEAQLRDAPAIEMYAMLISCVPAVAA